jgi:ribose transport system permease protein
MMRRLQLRLSQNFGLVLGVSLFLLLYVGYSFMHPQGGSGSVFIQNINEAMGLAFVAMAQTVPVLVSGLDLSVGPLMMMINCLASELVIGSGYEIAFGIVVCLIAGLAAGFLNGCIVVYGRIQPIIATLATGAIYIGIALFMRPQPGGEVDADLSWALTNDVKELFYTYGWFGWGDNPPAWFANTIGGIPMALVILLAVVLLVWIPFRRSVTGRGCYAVGSNEQAAYMSGVRVQRSKLAAFTLAGFFAACAGLFLGFQTGSGNADAAQAGGYTLNSIAGVVIGGTSLFGGVGGAIGSIFGAFVLRTISFFFRVIDENSWVGFLYDPLLQPLFEGIVLLLAVGIGAARVFRVRNRLSLFG